MRDVALSPDGVPISYEVQGSGEPALVFVHGWSCDGTYWSSQLRHFASRYRAVVMDLAGHGESGAGRRGWTISAFGQDVAAVVDRLALDRMVLIGHSMGGDVIVDAALRLRGRVAGVVWADAYGNLGEPKTAEEVQGFLARFREDFVTATRELVRGMFVPGSDPELVEWVLADMSAAPLEVAVPALEDSYGNEPAVIVALSRLQTPVVAINPDYRPTDVEGLRRHGVKAVLMPGVGHFEMMEDPERFNRLLQHAVEEMC
jgi:pimeloyl-ACP methyl ester carboxylesterase